MFPVPTRTSSLYQAVKSKLYSFVTNFKNQKFIIIFPSIKDCMLCWSKRGPSLVNVNVTTKSRWNTWRSVSWSVAPSSPVGYNQFQKGVHSPVARSGTLRWERVLILWFFSVETCLRIKFWAGAFFAPAC